MPRWPMPVSPEPTRPRLRLIRGQGRSVPSPCQITPLHVAAMARPLPAEFDKKKVVAENRRARYEYFLEDFFEAGIALTGTEVKSLRFGEGSIAEAYAE